MKLNLCDNREIGFSMPLTTIMFFQRTLEFIIFYLLYFGLKEKDKISSFLRYFVLVFRMHSLKLLWGNEIMFALWKNIINENIVLKCFSLEAYDLSIFDSTDKKYIVQLKLYEKWEKFFYNN